MMAEFFNHKSIRGQCYHPETRAAVLRITLTPSIHFIIALRGGIIHVASLATAGWQVTSLFNIEDTGFRVVRTSVPFQA